MAFTFVPVKKEPLGEPTETTCPIGDVSYLSQELPGQGNPPPTLSGERESAAQSHVSFVNELKCEPGKRVPEEEQSLNSDVRRVKCEQPFRTELCHKDFPSQCDLDHRWLHHLSPAGPRSTETASQNSYSRQMITLHVHHLEKKKQRYQCDVCPKTYAHTCSLKVHKRVHADQLPYACQLCPARFVRGSALRQHFLARHDVTRHPKCGRCGKTFTFSCNLERHMRVHSGETPHACHLCPRKFARTDNLLFHLRIHAGERPHSCTQCGKRFVTASILAAHFRCVHTPKPTYHCLICPRKYRSPGSLRAHVKTHARTTASFVPESTEARVP